LHLSSRYLPGRKLEMEAAQPSNASASSDRQRQTFEVPVGAKNGQKKRIDHLPGKPEDSLAAATVEMMRDPALQQIIIYNVHMIMSELLGDVHTRMTAMEKCLHQRIGRLEEWTGYPQSDQMPIQANSGSRQPTTVMQTERLSETSMYHGRPSCTKNQSSVSRESSPPKWRSESSSGLTSNDSRSYQDRRTPRDVPPPLQGMQRYTSSATSSPRSTPRSTPFASEGSRPSQSAQGRGSGHSLFRPQSSRRSRSSNVAPTNAQEVVQWQMRTIMGRRDFDSYEESLRTERQQRQERQEQQQQQEQHRHRHHTHRSERTSVIPEFATTPGRHDRRVSPYDVQNDDGEELGSEPGTSEDRASGRWQRLMGKRWWWPSRKGD